MLSFENFNEEVANKLGFRHYSVPIKDKVHSVASWVLVALSIIACTGLSALAVERTIDGEYSTLAPILSVFVVDFIFAYILFKYKRIRGSIKSNYKGRLLLGYVSYVYSNSFSDNNVSHIYLLVTYFDGHYHYISTCSLKGAPICSEGDFIVIRYVSDGDFAISVTDTNVEARYTCEDIGVDPPIQDVTQSIAVIHDKYLGQSTDKIQAALERIQSD